jgi:hypothetical protein
LGIVAVVEVADQHVAFDQLSRAAWNYGHAVGINVTVARICEGTGRDLEWSDEWAGGLSKRRRQRHDCAQQPGWAQKSKAFHVFFSYLTMVESSPGTDRTALVLVRAAQEIPRKS